MFIVTVEGQYYAEGKKIKKYSYTCKLPKMEAALSVIKNKIEARKLMKVLPDFVAVRTRMITHTTTEDGTPAAPDTDNPFEMTMDQLKDTIIEKLLPIKPEECTDIAELRQDVHDAIANAQKFLENKKIRDEERAVDRELNLLNPDLAEDPMQPTAPYVPPVEPFPIPLIEGADLPQSATGAAPLTDAPVNAEGKQLTPEGKVDPIQIENPELDDENPLKGLE